MTNLNYITYIYKWCIENTLISVIPNKTTLLCIGNKYDRSNTNISMGNYNIIFFVVGTNVRLLIDHKDPMFQ